MSDKYNEKLEHIESDLIEIKAEIAKLSNLLLNDDETDTKGAISRLNDFEKRLSQLEVTKKLIAGVITIAITIGGAIWKLVEMAFEYWNK